MSDLFEQIARMKGSITEYKTNKNKQKDITTKQPYQATYSGGKPFRGSYRGGRGGFHGAPIRNRSLIVNNNPNADGDYVSVKSAKGLTLVNKEVYKKELEKGNPSYEELQQQLAKKRAELQRHKAEIRASKIKVRLDYCDRCLVDGDLYAVSRYGAKLALLDPLVEQKTGQIIWNECTYTRDKAGNLKLQGQKVFLKEQCRFFQKTGECSRGTKCRYTHNKDKVALCPKVIKGTCTGTNEDGTPCLLSHTPSEFNTTLCHFFVRGSCRNPECPFLHTKPDLDLVCRQFSIGGYCFRGKSCNFKHVLECPDFQLTRECPRGKKCRLQHSMKNNLDAKLQFSTLDSQVLQLPKLTVLEDIHADPRITQSEIVEDMTQFHYESSDEENDASQEQLTEMEDSNLEIDADFIHF